MKKKRICMALAAALSLSLAISATALAAIPSDIGGHWAQGTIIQWTSNGYIAGYPDGTFKPDNSITRAEFVVMVNKAMGYNKRGNAYFSDVSAAHWAYAEIMKGVEAGYITGNGDGTFRPDAPVTRQEAAVMISKILGLDQDFASAAKYVDYRYIPSWAAGYVGAVSKAGIMTGYPDGDFKSDRVLTRAESVVSLDKTKNYDGKVEEDKDDREVFEDYRLTSSSLSDKIIKGDLIISSSLSNRNVSLDNVKVEGKLIVEGGKTVTADGCEISELEMNRSDVEFDATGRTKVGKTTFEKYGKLSGSGYSRVIIDEEFNSYIELDANIDYVELDADTNVRLLENCVIETFEATKNADNATVNFNKAEVEDMDIYDAIRITGRGDINNMTVYKSGVKSSIRPDHLDRRNGASKPDYTSTSSGDVGYNPGSRYDDLTIRRDERTYSGGRYDDVRVMSADDWVKLKNMTIYGDLTIDEDVENGDVYLDDLDIRGHVYIYGGGQDTVSFEDCQIEGNIYAKKDHGSRPVGLKIDSNTAEDLDGYISIEDNGAILENGGKLDKVYVLTGSTVEIDTNVKNLYVNAKTDNLTITSGTTVDKLSISSSSVKGSKITNNGTIKELNTSQNITVDGNGTVSKDTGNVTYEKSVTSVSLDKATAELTVGETLKLTATVSPSEAANKSVTWSSSDASVATVDANGNVKGVKAGTATITVTTADGGHTATCVVTVKEKPAETVPAESVTLDKKELTLTVGGTDGTLTATVKPADTTDKLKWTVSDNSENISITENNDGSVTVKALKATEENKTVTIVATAGSVSDTCTVTVNPKTVTVTSITISGAPQESIEVDGTFDLMANVTVEPTGSTYEGEIIWDQNSNPTDGEGDVVQITADETGKATVKALEAGTATITAKAGDQTATCEVTVTAKTVEVESVTITGTGVENKKATMTAGDTLQLSAMVLPEGATEQGVTWESSNDSFATVTNGTVTAANVTEQKTVTITAKSVSNEEKSDSITITVNPVAVTGIQLNQSSVELTGINSSTTLTATVTPNNAANKEVTWRVENTEGSEVVRLSGTTGNSITVTAVGSGTATITATSKANSEVTAICEVTVTVPVTGVTIKAPEGTQGGTTEIPAALNVGETLQLTATVKPAEANYDKNQISWDVTSGAQYVTISTPAKGETITVTGKSAGEATITAKVDATHSATFTITVKAASTPTPGDGGTETGGNQTGTGGNQSETGAGNGNQPVTGGEGQTPVETTPTTQATSNAIVVSR